MPVEILGKGLGIYNNKLKFHYNNYTVTAHNHNYKCITDALHPQSEVQNMPSPPNPNLSVWL
jgi:hypothetical protein